MSELLGADSRRVDLIAEGLRGYSQDIQNLRTLAQRAVAEMRTDWRGPDFERIAQRWEQEAGPRLTDVSSALSTMATTLRAQAEEQSRVSGNSAGLGGNRTDASSSSVISGHQAVVGSVIWGTNGEKVNEPTPPGHEKLNLAGGDAKLVDESLASAKGEGDGFQYELSAGTVEAGADYSVDIDAHGNLVASAGVSAAAYAGYAAGTVTRGNDFANGTAEGKAYVGAEVKADGSGSIGPDGARGHLGAEAFVGGKAEASVRGAVAGVTATAGAEISYGIGAHADVDAEISATQVGASVDIGAALGIGAGFKADASVNPQEVMVNVGHAANDVGEGLTHAGDQVVSFLDW